MREPPEEQKAAGLRLPCGGCIGCRTDRAREWAYRNQLEARTHRETCWITLTYDDDHLPEFGTLEKSHLSNYLKRLRRQLDNDGKRIRFFGCGEYGEQNERPHYHAILYGTREHRAIHKAWPHGFTRCDPLTPEAISYVAGYAAKKLGIEATQYGRDVDADGVLTYERQAPFLLMSRRPGIGADAKQHWRSWRTHGIWDGMPLRAPRFLHEAWKANATEEEREELLREKLTVALRRDTTKEQLENRAKHQRRRQEMRAEKRHL